MVGVATVPPAVDVEVCEETGPVYAWELTLEAEAPAPTKGLPLMVGVTEAKLVV